LFLDKMAWRLVDSGCDSALNIMQKDQEMLESLSNRGDCILHLYRWKGVCATYGYFIRPFDFLNREGVLKAQLELARRPTGGGILFHLTDLAFSILVPRDHEIYLLNTLESYATINNRIKESLRALFFSSIDPLLLTSDHHLEHPDEKSFCMARPTQYDIMIDGKKIGGAAQRRTKRGLLHQGSLFLMPPPDHFLETVLLKDSSIRSAIHKNCGSIMRGDQIDGMESVRNRVQEMLKEIFL
jgi:lipoate---protein ligase